MSTNAPPPATPVPPAPRNSNLRYRGVLLFVFVLVEILIGNQLALSNGPPYPIVYLVLHVLVAIGLVLGSGYALMIALRLPSRAAQGVAALTFVAALGATISGTVFLYGGQSNSALLGMEGFGGLALLGALLLIVFGSVPIAPSSPAAAPSS